MGAHIIKTWSSTLPGLPLSSGEAEYYGLVKAASYGLGTQAMIADMGVKTPLRVYTDASAAMGIAHRKGIGKVRQNEVSQLWVQDKVRKKALKITKVDGTLNLADALTKALDQEGIRKHMGVDRTV